eukprot:7454634-Pyramimonas_sp.AAC.1
MLGAQPLEVSCPISKGPELLGDVANVDVIEGPAYVDVMSTCSVDPSMRCVWLNWVVGDSDVDVCVALSGPSPIVPTVPLSGSTVP